MRVGGWTQVCEEGAATEPGLKAQGQEGGSTHLLVRPLHQWAWVGAIEP